MVEIFDADALFAAFAKQYVSDNMAGLSPEEIEDRIGELYEAFSVAPIPELGGKTLGEYYAAFSADELVDALAEHLEKDVDPPAALCETIANKKGGEEKLLGLLDEGGEEALLYAMNLLSDKGCRAGESRYLNFILWDYPEPVRELATELLSENPDGVTEDVIAAFSSARAEVKPNLCEILSRCPRDDRALAILVGEFTMNPTDVPMYAGFLSRYGDERALPYLIAAAENEKTDYVDYCELVSAIEALGGEWKKTRDFSNDKGYLAAKSARENADKTEGENDKNS